MDAENTPRILILNEVTLKKWGCVSTEFVLDGGNAERMIRSNEGFSGERGFFSSQAL
jgi:hypothetical protein